MPQTVRKQACFCARRCRTILVLCLVLIPLIYALQYDSEQTRIGIHSNFITTHVPRGGDNGKPPINDDDDDDEWTRFWSLSALFRLNANAKDDASSSSAASHLQRGNKRGGALAVQTSKSKTFVDVTPVSTASSRLVHASEEESDENEQDEIIEPLIFDDLQDSGIIEEIEEMESSSDITEDVEEGEESGQDKTPQPTASSRIADDIVEDLESDVEEQDNNVEQMTGVEILRKIKEDIALEAEEPTESVETSVATEEQESDVQATSSYVPTKAKDMVQDASKYWWNNVWMEQTSEAIAAELDELDSDVSEGDDVSAQHEIEVVEEPSADIVDVEIQQVEKEEEQMQEPAVEDESPTDLSVPDSVGVDDDHGSVEEKKSQAPESDVALQVEPQEVEESPFISSGYWGTIDKVVSLGLSEVSPSWKLSRHLRSVRKATAHATGLHGFVSGKREKLAALPENAIRPTAITDSTLDDDDLGMIQRRIAAIEIAKQNVAKRAAEKAEAEGRRPRRGLFGRRRRRQNQIEDEIDAAAAAVAADVAELDDSEIFMTIERMSLEEQLEEERRKARVQEIDLLISKGQKSLLDLQCEKDDLQRRPNPLYNYTTASDGKTSRKFSFPPQELVDEYISELFANGRLEKMNHTHLWKNGAGLDDDEDESIGDDLFVPSADARKLYERKETNGRSPRGSASKSGNGNGGGGSWLLRQNLGKGGSLGEKIGETTETAAYKAVCAAVMSSLARSIAAIHGINIMTHTDIRLYMEQSPDLPPVGKNVIPGSDAAQNYAQEAILDAMRKGVTKRKKRGSRSRRLRVEEAFMQRDAVVETLLSHCQISAPLLKLFPLAWQRALLGNIITLITAVVSDFCDGIQLQILGHQLSFSFKPITERDMIRHMGLTGTGFNHRRARPEQFEAAVRATADDVSAGLQFLDRWHHRALGSGMLRAQIANLIARIVLTLADEVLSGARMDLWSAQAGGPRMLAGLEYRVTPDDVNKAK